MNIFKEKIEFYFRTGFHRWHDFIIILGFSDGRPDGYRKITYRFNFYITILNFDFVIKMGEKHVQYGTGNH